MSILGKIMDNLEIDTSFKGNLIESVERYGNNPESGTAKTAKFISDDRSKSASVETGSNEGGNQVFNPGESPESGTSITAKFSKEDRKKSGGDTQVEEVKKDFGTGESIEGEKPVEVPATGKKEEEITNKNLNLHEGAMSELDIVKQQLKSDIEEGLVDIHDIVNDLLDLLNPEQVQDVAKRYGYLETESEELQKNEYTAEELKAKFGTDNVDIINAGKPEDERVSLKKDEVNEAGATLGINAGVDIPDDLASAAGMALMASEEKEDERLDEIGPVAAGLLGAAGGAIVGSALSSNKQEEDEELEEEPTGAQPSEIEIQLDDNGESTNIVEVKFNTEHNKADVDAAIKNFCGEQFFVVLDPVSSEEEDGSTKYTFEFSEFNRDEDLEAFADELSDEECIDGDCEEISLPEPEEVEEPEGE